MVMVSQRRSHFGKGGEGMGWDGGVPAAGQLVRQVVDRRQQATFSERLAAGVRRLTAMARQSIPRGERAPGQQREGASASLSSPSSIMDADMEGSLSGIGSRSSLRTAAASSFLQFQSSPAQALSQADSPAPCYLVYFFRFLRCSLGFLHLSASSLAASGHLLCVDRGGRFTVGQLVMSDPALAHLRIDPRQPRALAW